MMELTFKIYERGNWAYILWPWENPGDLLYDCLPWGAKYKLKFPGIARSLVRLALVPGEGTRGEYTHGLHFGNTHWGSYVFRRFAVRGSHYLAQHGLDGLPDKLWRAAHELSPGDPIGQARFTFQISTKKGAFGLSFFEWQRYLASSQDGHISNMGIEITKRVIVVEEEIPLL